jgi:hypothetical protein
MQFETQEEPIRQQQWRQRQQQLRSGGKRKAGDQAQSSSKRSRQRTQPAAAAAGCAAAPRGPAVELAAAATAGAAAAGSAPAKPAPSYGAEVVGRQVLVFWPCHNAWFEGRIAKFTGRWDTLWHETVPNDSACRAAVFPLPSKCGCLLRPGCHSERVLVDLHKNVQSQQDASYIVGQP